MTEKHRGASPMINEAQPNNYEFTKPRSRQSGDIEVLRLREALVSAIEENESLRERVIELEALLGAAQ